MCQIFFILTLVLLPTLIFSYQNTSVCTGQYFDTTEMTCSSCLADQTFNQTSGFTCSCSPNFYTADHNQIGFKGTCTQCPTVNFLIKYNTKFN